MSVTLTLILLFICSCGVAGQRDASVCEDHEHNLFEIRVVNIKETCYHCRESCDTEEYKNGGPQGEACSDCYKSQICDYSENHACELYVRLTDSSGSQIGPERWLNSDWATGGVDGEYTYIRDEASWQPFVPNPSGQCIQIVDATVFDENYGKISTDKYVVDLPLHIDLKNTKYRLPPYLVSNSVPVSVYWTGYRAWITVTVEVRKVGCLVPFLHAGRFREWSNGVGGPAVGQHQVIKLNDKIDNICYEAQYFRKPVGPMTCISGMVPQQVST